MKKSATQLTDALAVARIQESDHKNCCPYTGWIGILRRYLRMTQADLSRRSGIPQSHISGIETGKIDPRMETLGKIFAALYCDVCISPVPHGNFDDVLEERAKLIASARLKQAAGNMAMSGKYIEQFAFDKMLEIKTKEILFDHSEKLWRE